MKNGLTVFREKIGGWMANPDGEPLCRSCFKSCLSQLPEDKKHEFQKLSKPLTALVMGHQHGATRREKTEAAQVRRNYRSPNGWLAICEKCQKSILTTYSAGETN